MNRQQTIALLAWDAAVRSHRIHQMHCVGFSDKERTQAFDMQSACGVVALKALYAISPEQVDGPGFYMPLLVAHGR